MASPNVTVNPEDLRILRELARRKLDAVAHPDNVARRALWLAHDAGRGERPLVLAESHVSFADLPASQTQCAEQWARDLEWGLRFDLWQFEVMKDDHVLEPWVNTGWRVSTTDYGVQTKTTWADRVSGNVSSRHWDPPLTDLPRDLDLLKPRSFSVDRETSLAWRDHLAEVFDGTLGVRIRGGFWWTTGLTWSAIDLIGLEQFMLAMAIDGESIHRLMAFLSEDLMEYTSWLEAEGLFTLNNENDYIGSGSMGYTASLPAEGYTPAAPARPRDLWTLCESQETVSVSPSMFEEFVFQYQRPIAERFGACYYGCCEPVNNRWHVIKKLKNLRRVSVSPWCDEAFMAEALGRGIAFSRKPNPALVSTERWDEEAIVEDLRTTLQAAAGCSLELIMKDVHTLAGEPMRLARWVELAKQGIDRWWAR
jgi:hypothetical protein